MHSRSLDGVLDPQKRSTQQKFVSRRIGQISLRPVHYNLSATHSRCGASDIQGLTSVSHKGAHLVATSSMTPFSPRGASLARLLPSLALPSSPLLDLVCHLPVSPLPPEGVCRLPLRLLRPACAAAPPSMSGRSRLPPLSAPLPPGESALEPEDAASSSTERLSAPPRLLPLHSAGSYKVRKHLHLPTWRSVHKDRVK